MSASGALLFTPGMLMFFRLLHARLMGDALYDDPDPDVLEAPAGERGRFDQCERVTL